MSGKMRGSEGLTKLQWTAIFYVGLCVGEKIEGVKPLTKLQWTRVFDVGLCVGGKERKWSLKEATVDRNL